MTTELSKISQSYLLDEKGISMVFFYFPRGNNSAMFDRFKLKWILKVFQRVLFKARLYLYRFWPCSFIRIINMFNFRRNWKAGKFLGLFITEIEVIANQWIKKYKAGYVRHSYELRMTSGNVGFSTFDFIQTVNNSAVIWGANRPNSSKGWF